MAPLAQSIPSITPTNILAVAPVPENVVDPGIVNSFVNKAPDTTSLSRTRGLYVTNSATTNRLIDYTENLDGETAIYSIDDDHDGDLDVYYSLDGKIYRKENHQKTPKKYHISDAPRVYDTASIYEEFFGIENGKLSALPGDGQISLLRNNSYGNISNQFLTRSEGGHMRLSLFGSLFQSNPVNAAYTVDIFPKSPTAFPSHTILSVPQITATE